jgi:hypothetical protein
VTDLELENIHALTVKLQAETAKLNAEAVKLQKESKWFPVIWATAFVAAVLALAKFIH